MNPMYSKGMLRNHPFTTHVIQYLTGTFTPYTKDYGDHMRNSVLWGTAMFIEHTLVDWGLSGAGGFWVGTTRFANNDVQNLVNHRDKAMQLFSRSWQHVKSLKMSRMSQSSKKEQPPQPSRVAFLYVVVKKLGFLKNEQTLNPHLLIIGHTQPGNAPRHWGVPGGMRDATDASSVANAMREFGEEVLGKKRMTGQDVAALISQANKVGKLRKLTQSANKTYTAWLLVVDSALQFEMAFALPKRTAEEKYNVALSGETRGYLYVPLPLTTLRKSSNDPWTVRAPAALNYRPLILRSGVYVPSREIDVRRL